MAATKQKETNELLYLNEIHIGTRYSVLYVSCFIKEEEWVFMKKLADHMEPSKALSDGSRRRERKLV